MPSAHEVVILFVDDEVVVRNIAQRILTRAGFTVLAAANGQEALELFQAFPETIHMLVSDIHMPKVDGITLARQVLSAQPGIKILLVSGNVDLVGANIPANVLLKPFQPAALLTAVRATLAGVTHPNDDGGPR